MRLLTERAEPAVDLPAVDVALPRVNLLPPEIAERAHFQKVQLGLAGGLLLVVGAVGAVYASAVGSVEDAGAAVDAANASGAALRAESTQYAGVTDVYDRAATATGTLAEVMGQEVRYSHYLHTLARSVPRDVWLKDVSFTQTAPGSDDAAGATDGGIGTVTFTGVGFRHDDVAAWLESLGKQKGYSNPYFSNSTVGLIGSRSTVSFSSTVTLTAEALSGRYTAENGS